MQAPLPEAWNEPRCIPEEDMSFLKSVLKNDPAPAHVRALAGLSLGRFMGMANQPMTEAFKVFSRVLKLTMSDRERSEPCPESIDACQTLGDVFDASVLGAKAYCDAMSQLKASDVQNHVTAVPERYKGVLSASLKLPGSSCDGCQKPCTVDGVRLMKCQKCQRKYYCSKACQVCLSVSAADFSPSCPCHAYQPLIQSVSILVTCSRLHT